MALIGMAIYSTAENGKDEYLRQTLASLERTVDFSKHSLMLSVNAKTEETEKIIFDFSRIIEKVIYNDTNIGTAEAINKVWALRGENEHCVKMDDDVVIHQAGWLDLACQVVDAAPWIGQVGLKRKDLIESPDNPNEFYRSELKTVGTIQVEQCHHIMGTCVLHSAKLLKEVGFLWQPELYGFDDAFMSLRSELAKFKNCFLTGIDIDHIDPGKTAYQRWKEGEANKYLDGNPSLHKIITNEFKSGQRDIYYKP